MNILLLAKKNPYPASDGESIAISQMATGLKNAGHDVSVLYMNTPKHHFNADQIPDHLKSEIRFYDVSVNTSVHAIHALSNLFSSIPYHAERFNQRAYASRLEALLKKEKYDLIQLEGLYLTAYIPLIRKYSNAKITYRSHNIEGNI